MVLTRTRVTRPLVLLEPDDHCVLETVNLTATVALARCLRCGTRPRVLPCDALPAQALRAGVDRAPGVGVLERRSEPAEHRLDPARRSDTGATRRCMRGTEGLGAYALGRPAGGVGGAPISRFVGDADARVPGVADSMREGVVVDLRRYRSEPRRDRLAAIIRTLSVARAVAGKPHPRALAECRRLELVWSQSSVFEFRTGISCTSIERCDRSGVPGLRASCPKSRDRGRARTRSPPGASSKSPP